MNLFARIDESEMVLIIVAMGIGMIIILSVLKTLGRIFTREGRGGRSKNEDAEETKLIQELYQSQSRLEDRIESLETLLVDRESRMHDRE